MKKAVILIALVAILAGAGGAGWWFFLREAPEDAEAAEAAPKSGDASRSIDLQPFVLPILRKGQVTRHLTLVLTIEFTEPTSRAAFKLLVPRLRDSLLSELHGVLAFRHVYERDRVISVVRERLKKVSNEALGPGTISAVLVKAMSSRIPDET